MINGALYLIEGDGVNAGLTFAAAIPFAGWVATGAKWCGIAIEVAPGVSKILKITIEPSGLLKFSHNNSSQFREILNMSGSYWNDFQAHHLLPKNFWDHPTLQKAAQSKNFTFHMNHPRNGIPLHDSRHLGYHNNYNNQIEALLTELDDLYPNANPSEIAVAIEGFQTYLKNLIEGSNQHINDIVIDYTW
ncbi:MAG: AHH domain-containing protein [Lewinellaceae bacterium]|nr:AHH domain-containing protein [Lewinellaceae bacterium]